MKTHSAVLYDTKAIEVREVKLPQITEDEVLVKVVSNSICLSTYKAAILGSKHKRVPDNLKEVPVMTGHEFCGVIIEVGKNPQSQYHVGQTFVLQPAMGLPSGYSPGYSYPYFGGNTEYCIVPKVAIDHGCILPMNVSYFANASLAEPMSCIIGAFHASYHTEPYVYEHKMGIVEGGKLALLGCCGPMGIGAIDYALHGPRRPKILTIIDNNKERLERAKGLFPVEQALKEGIELRYFESIEEVIGEKYDDVFVFAPVAALLEAADELLGNDGCLNFFAGPTDKQFKVPFNYYNVHYEATHIVGTSGGSTQDMIEAVELAIEGKINPSYMVTHIGGLDAAPDTILNLPNIPGGKKLIYPHIQLPLTAIEDFEKLGQNNPLFKQLDEVCKKHKGIWNQEAEQILLSHFDKRVN